MKKLFTLLFLTAALFSFKGNAQNLPCTGLSVNFTSQAGSPNTNVIEFTNTSIGYAVGDTIQWTFGDGSTSSVSNPTHTYTSGGVKQVCLIIRKVVQPGASPCVGYHCTQITVVIPNTACNLTVSYTSQALGTQPNVIQFTSTSTGYAAGDTILWTFGDGSSSSQLNPLHTFATGGTYHVCLTIRKAVPAGVAPCLNYSCRDIVITMPCTLSASFISQPSSSNSLGVYFTNTSTGYAAGDSLVWSFGDGTYAYNIATAYHAYANAGTYTVCLHVRKASAGTVISTCVSDICHTVIVTAPFVCDLSVSYTYAATPNGPNVISFTNTSTGYAPADTIQWTFGDGTTSSVSNPTHTFATAGTYHVCLIIKRVVPAGAAACANYSCHDIVVTVPCNLTASFTSQPSTSNPLGVYFTNTSTGYAAGDSLVWSFGDGTYAYNTATVYHAYANAGTYTVCLHVRKASAGTVISTCVSDICHAVVASLPCNLVVSFTSQPATGAAPNIIQFTSTSTGYTAGDTILWTFGDGTTSTQLNPIHTYTTGNTYQVCLTIRKVVVAGTAPCVNYTCHTIAVTVPVCTLSASFSSQTGSNMTVYFTNTSAGFATGDSIHWSFGDGTDSYATNPVHTYTAAGVYNVCLWVKKNNFPGTAPCVSEICHTAIVSAACNLVVSYTSTPAAGTPNVIQFTSTSTGYAVGDTISWTFGDGSSSTTLNPLHTYANAGTYQVCLIIKKAVAPGTAPCVNYHCESITVTLPCTLSASFTSQPSTSNSLGVYFTNTSTGYATGDSIRWSFGDGTTAYTSSAYHVYTNAGVYNVCLWVKKNNGSVTTPACVSEICHTVVVSAPCNLAVNYTSTATAGAPNVIQFTSTSTGYAAGDTIQWTFGDGSTSATLNPLHTFATGGTYHVCLIIRKAVAAGTAACANYSCHDIVVENPCTIVSGYTEHADSQNYLLIHFTNTTTPVNSNNSVTWYFGDGSYATSPDADHQYAHAGTYYACLRVQYGTCVSYHCDSVHVIEPQTPCSELANFHYTTISATGLGVVFTPDHISTDVTYTWTFGDGTGSHDIPATHVFATAGYYTVCLTAYRNNSCAATSCTIVHLPSGSTPNCNDITLGFVTTTNTSSLNSVTFTGSSNAPILDQVWTITRVPATVANGTVTLHAINPTYAFSDTGTYNVCLHATFAGGCTRDYCRQVHVTFPVGSTNACSLQLYPNPATSTINAMVTLNQAGVINTTVYSSSNMQVIQKEQQGAVGINTVNLNIASLPAGVYTMRVSYGNQYCYATFIKQ